MKRRPIQWNFLSDDGGQALTEFVIVIPIILLLFFAMLQFFADVEAAQLGNYAAFMSARVYAVDNSVDSSGSQDKAQKAAAWALAPIAGPAPGEANLGGIVPGVGTLVNFISGFKAGKIALGYATAEYGRFGVLGGSVSNNVEGSSPPQQQVHTTINYPQPIFVPGLASMWNFVTGDKIYYSMKPLRQGLGGLPGAILPVYETYNQAQQLQQQLAQFDPNIPKLPDLPIIILPYVNIQSKCSMGYANWQYYNGGPRVHATSSDTDSSTSDSSTQNLGNQAKQANDAANAAKDDQEAVSKNCAALQKAQQDVANDQTSLNNANAALAADPKNVTKQLAVDSAKGQLSSDQGKEQSAQNDYNSAKGKLNTDQQNLQSSGVSVPPTQNTDPCSN
jgi:hypothetical protein